MKLKNSPGFALPEVAVTFVVAAVGVAATTAVALPFMEREKMRSSVYSVQSVMQLTRMEAVTRNRPTRFVVNAATGTLEIYDTMGTSTFDDDERLHTRMLPENIRFESPDDEDPITMAGIGGTDAFYAVFSGDGVVSEGAGAISLRGGKEEFEKVTVHWAGGVATERWNEKRREWAESRRAHRGKSHHGSDNGNGNDGAADTQH